MGDRTLYHFTCPDHGGAALRDAGEVRPNWHPMLRRRLAWFTDLPEPSAEQVGLTRTFTSCDRLALRYIVDDPSACVPFSRLKRLPADIVRDLVRFGAPQHWWVSTRPVPVHLDTTAGADQ